MGFNYRQKSYSTPYNEQVITVMLKAVKQKMYRQIHCFECGWPYADITDKMVAMFDAETPVGVLEPDAFGIIDLHCPNRSCRQHYRLEFAV